MFLINKLIELWTIVSPKQNAEISFICVMVLQDDFQQKLAMSQCALVQSCRVIIEWITARMWLWLCCSHGSHAEKTFLNGRTKWVRRCEMSSLTTKLMNWFSCKGHAYVFFVLNQVQVLLSIDLLAFFPTILPMQLQDLLSGLGFHLRKMCGNPFRSLWEFPIPECKGIISGDIQFLQSRNVPSLNQVTGIRQTLLLCIWF